MLAKLLRRKQMKRNLEIRGAEGGEDAQLFAKDLAAAYQKMFGRIGWKNRLISSRLGEIIIEVIGEDLSLLYNECGGHRIQRVPPTERKGRVHTSTVTVAVTDSSIATFEITESDLKIEWFSGTGSGGIVATAQTRSRQNSEKLAREDVYNRLQAAQSASAARSIANERKQQVGSGMRGDKIRTYRFQDDSATDHITCKRASVRKILAGIFDILWPTE